MREKYDQTLRQTEEWPRLYQLWSKKIKFLPHDPEWDEFLAFYHWSMKNGYELGSYLRTKNDVEFWSPKTCVWKAHGVRKRSDISPEFVKNWNAAVNRIRKQCGMPPLEGTEYG